MTQLLMKYQLKNNMPNYCFYGTYVRADGKGFKMTLLADASDFNIISTTIAIAQNCYHKWTRGSEKPIPGCN